jgi:hypothetical protein
VIVKTKSEALFEAFCALKQVAWKPVPTESDPTPDYCVTIPEIGLVYVEVKQIDADSNFGGRLGSMTRVVGDHVRAKISESRKQVQIGAKSGFPSILLIYNNLDPSQKFGTEQHDFISAMYGELTVTLTAGRISDSFQGRNAMLRQSHNSSYSAVGHLCDVKGEPQIQLYENVFAQIPIDFGRLPSCFSFQRVAIERGAA